MLPKNEKVQRTQDSQKRLLIYGEPTIGKTIFSNKFPNSIFLNTDGNIKYIDSPVIPIVNQTNMSAWEVYVNSIDAILTENHNYETVIIDLLDDIYQYCRTYFYKQLKITHESELGFGKGWDIVRNAFIMPIKGLLNSGLNVVLISHEKAETVKDRIGRELTRYKPNLPDAIIDKLSGMVDITGRILIKTEETDDGVVENRVLYLNSTKDQVGGNRIPTITQEYIPLDYAELVKIYGGEK